MHHYTLKAGLFGIGLDAYWPQFEGLKQRLEGYLEFVEDRFKKYDFITTVNLGLVDTHDKALEAGHQCRQQDIDILFLYVTTYALSATVLPVVQRANVPVVVLNLAPEAAIDYTTFNQLQDRTKMTGEWLAHCTACSVPEILNVLKRANVSHFQVTGWLHEEASWKEIEEWLKAAHVAHTLFHNRMGCMGHYYSGMLDVYTDLTRQCAYFGGHFELIEVDELTGLRDHVTPDEVAERVRYFHDVFEVQPDCANEELERAAKTSLALDQLVARYGFRSMAYYYKGTGDAGNEDTMSSIILGTSLLTANGVPVAGEYEIKNAQAMKILDTLGAGGSFTEYYAMDYTDDVVLMGHDGPGHIAIAHGKTKVRPLFVYHGKVGKGLSVEMSVKHGPVTLLSVVETADGKLKLLTAEGTSVPGSVLEIGNTNSRYRFPIGARAFTTRWNEEGPAHHCAVGIGHVAAILKKVGALLKIDVVQVC